MPQAHKLVGDLLPKVRVIYWLLFAGLYLLHDQKQELNKIGTANIYVTILYAERGFVEK